MAPNVIHEKYRAERSREIALVCCVTSRSITAVYYDLALERRVGRSCCFGESIAQDTLMYTLRTLIHSSMGEYSISAEEVKKAAFAAPAGFTALMLLRYDTPEDYLLHPDTELLIAPTVEQTASGGFTAALASVELSDGTAVAEISDRVSMAWQEEGVLKYASYPLTGALAGCRLDCGMPDERGAVDDVWREPDGTLCYSVEGDGDGCGISPSGAVAALRVMLAEGIVDADGIMTDRDMLYIGEELYISQADVRALQSDRAMIAAAMSLLPEGCTVYFSGEVFAANGMRAMKETGAIPSDIAGRAGFCRSASEQGLINLLADGALAEKIDRLAADCEDVSGAFQPQIDDLYIKNLGF